MAIAEDSSRTVTTSYWHPFADMGAVSRSELVIERGEGAYVFDAEGRRYLDGTASLWYANLGHGRADVTRAVAAQMDRLAAYQTFGDFSNRPANELAARLAALAPMEDAKVFLASGGGDAIDTAAKIARRHWVLQGRPERMHLLSRTNGYHGTHGFGTAIGGIEANTANWGPLVPHTSAVPFDSLPALEQEILRVGPERVAAFFCEPVIGAGGVHLQPEGLIERGRELEAPLRDALAPLAGHDAVGEVRAGLGLLGAVELSESALAGDPAAVGKVAAGAREAGVLVRPLLRGVAVSPPLTVEREHLDALADAIRAGLDRL